MSDDLDIPDFLRLTAEQRKKIWEDNPPKFTTMSSWGTPEQEAAEKARLQSLVDKKRLQKCLAKQKRVVRQEVLEAQLEDRSHAKQGHVWDARSAKWIDPIEAALKPEGEKKVTVTTTETKKTNSKAKVKKEKSDKIFPFLHDSYYDRMMTHLLANLDKMVPVKELAEKAYGTNKDIEKHCRRVVTMARKVKEKVIEKKRLPYNIVKEKKEDDVSIGLFAK